MPATSLVIHAHLYQPPREDPWSNEVPREPSAAPYHDWNARITAECYRPIAPLLDRMSFDVGPTLFEWMDEEAPDLAALYIEKDRASVVRLGHGNAMAMPYHHMILPLASRRDREIEIGWGIRDFERRYGRRPEGLWLPETAVDLETLDILARQGILFTVLAGHQVEQAPLFGTPAAVRTTAGRRISVFVYDGDLSHEVAFGPLLEGAASFASRLVPPPNNVGAPVAISIATDGETYGHHHVGGVAALAGALDITGAAGLEATNFAAFLARHPARDFARIVENTSWSCVHGVERWRSDCGCRMVEGTSQAWRRPLREALDWLRRELDELLDAGGAVVPGDPAEARHQLPMDWHGHRMFSSCAWFFDELERIEPRLAIAHATRACELAGEARGRLLEGLNARLPAGKPAASQSSESTIGLDDAAPNR